MGYDGYDTARCERMAVKYMLCHGYGALMGIIMYYYGIIWVYMGFIWAYMGLYGIIW
jgi:hypothetical protein